MAEFVVDTNVLSRIFTGDKNVKQFIETLDAAVCTVVCRAQSRIARNELLRVISLGLSFAISHPTSPREQSI
jgi:predicted nucleic acid-binding protein